MPGDRLVVYRDPIVRGTVFLNRLAEPFLTVVNSVQLFSFAARGVQFLGAPLNAGTGLGNGLNNGIQNANQLTPNFR
jgi:polysaccharide export outer membrane protein